MNRLAHRLATVAAAAVMATPALAIPATTANASVPLIPASAFGMHYLNTGHAYPAMPFSTARIWDMHVTWADLQPNAPQYSTDPLGLNPPQLTSDGYDANAWARLDSIVQMFLDHHVEPMITLGMTPAWAADTGSSCQHVDGSGYDWGLQTCAPVPSVANWGDPWANYVTKIAQRYQGKVHYFELWNEPNLRNGYNDSITTLASMQQTAYGALQSYGEKLVSPSIPFTAGASAAFNWMNTFFHQPGGKSFDITGLHLYPSDAAAKGGYGPEWAMNTALAGARKVLSNNGIAGRPIWNTETNVGRAPAHTVVGGGTAGAAAVARTYLLNIESNVARTIWYGADERSWGGTWLENSDFRTLSTAGVGYNKVRAFLVGKAALGCSRTTVGTNKWKYTCRFGTSTRHQRLLAIWTTGANYTLHAPAGSKYWYTVTGARRSAYKGKALTISHTPIYLTGYFS